MKVPTNEQELIIKFAQEHGPRFEIVRCNTASFPDAIVAIDGTEQRVEFEFELKSFRHHRHDIRQCDVVICWTRGAVKDFPLPVFVLEERGWQDIEVTQALAQDLEIWHWKSMASAWKYTATQLKARLREEKPDDPWNAGEMTELGDAIFSILDQDFERSNRGIARELKCSPSSVTTWR